MMTRRALPVPDVVVHERQPSGWSCKRRQVPPLQEVLLGLARGPGIRPLARASLVERCPKAVRVEGRGQLGLLLRGWVPEGCSAQLRGRQCLGHTWIEPGHQGCRLGSTHADFQLFPHLAVRVGGPASAASGVGGMSHCRSRKRASIGRASSIGRGDDPSRGCPACSVRTSRGDGGRYGG